MTTALELITSSMRLATILASGETPTADEAIDGLKSLNDILENWSTERLTMWQLDDQQFALVPGQASYTIGPGGNFSTTRPIRVSPSFSRINGTDFPIQTWGMAEYSQVTVKSIGGIPERMVYLNEYPLGQIILYPVPAAASTLFLSCDRVLATPALLSTALSFPPGYEKALRYTLAVNLCPEYGIEPSVIIQQIAASSKGDLKRANKIPVRAAYDPMLMGESAFAYYQRGY